MSNPTATPRPLECVFLDAGDTLLAPWPSFQGRFVAVAREHGVSLEEAQADAAIAATARQMVWPTDWTDPATQRELWCGFYLEVLERLGRAGDHPRLAGALYRSFSDPAAYKLFDDVRPALAALCILTFLGNWNAFLWPLIVIQDPLMRTLPVGLSQFSYGEAGSRWELIMTGASIATVPVLIVFAIFQRQIIRGVALTGLKG